MRREIPPITVERFSMAFPHGFVLVLFGDIAELSPNRRYGVPAHARRIKNEWKERALLEWMSLGCPVLNGKVRVHFTAYRGRSLDHCNLHGSGVLKAVIDGLKQKAFPDDDPKHLEWGSVEQVTGAIHQKNPVLSVRVQESSP